MSENCTHDCSSCSSNCGERKAPLDLHIAPHETTHIKNVIAVASGKGGVGKSLITSLLAVQMRRMGYKVGILDADITGPSIPQGFCLHENAMGTEEGLLPTETKTGIKVMSLNLLLENETDPVIWRGPVIMDVVKQFWKDVLWEDLDYLFVDMPPGTGDVPLTVFQSLPVEGIVFATAPQALVGMIVEKAVHMAEAMNIPVLGIVENMSYFQCPDCGKQHHIYGDSHIDEIASKLGIDTVCRLPIRPEVAAMVDEGRMEEIVEPGLDAMAEKLKNL